MLLSKRAKNLLEKKEGKEREKKREKDRKIYRPIISLSRYCGEKFVKFLFTTNGICRSRVGTMMNSRIESRRI